MKKIVLIAIVLMLFYSLETLSQTKELDSLRAIVDAYPKRDTTRIRLIQNYTSVAININTSKMLPYVNDMISISKEHHYRRGLQIAYSTQEIYYADRGEFPTAFLYADSAFQAFEGDTSKVAIIEKAFLHHNMAMECFKLGDYERAIDHYTQAAFILEKQKPAIVGIVYDGIAEVYDKIGQIEKSEEYDKKAIATAEKYSSPSFVAGRYLNYITRLISRNQYTEAELALNKVEPIVKKDNKPIQLFLFYESKGLILQHSNQIPEAIEYLENANKLAHLNEDVYQQLAILGPLAESLIDAGQMDKAKLYLDTLLQKSIEYKTNTYLLDAYTMLAKWHQNKADYKTAIEFLNKKIALADSISSVATKEKISTMEVRYQVAEKNREIKLLQDQKQIQQLQLRQKSTLNYLIISGAAALLLISLLLIRNYKHRQRLQQQRISELETEKQLSATEAILKGEEQERSRLAKDLHDGLGGMLSGVKYSLSNMKENIIMSPADVQAFEHSINMLDSSINEMRRVAHNLMPESLLKFGLDAALQDFCSEMSRSGMLKVIYQSFGIKETSLDRSLSVTTYRIIQELLNNIIKYAEANQAIVQVSKMENHMSITVEDDGKGMDVSDLKNKNGIGWDNIQSRVAYHNGTINIQSEPHKGTSIFIEFPIA
ncbi:MAG: tetratricopeptide repeat protein [Bacteroidetes bacterium]|nr:tetratricopeptide repeat protein [Bacteroidota bacterium]